MQVSDINAHMVYKLQTKRNSFFKQILYDTKHFTYLNYFYLVYNCYGITCVD